MSVETSSKASSTATESPTFFNQRVTVPSLTLSPNAGIVITVPEVDGAAATGAGSATTGAATTGAGAAATGAATTGAATTAAATGAAAPSAIIANSAPTGTV